VVITGNNRADTVTLEATLTSRSDSVALVIDLARRLAEEFDAVPLPMVGRAVRSATEAATLFGEDVSTSLDTIERIAREDLIALHDAAQDGLLAG